MHVRNRMSGSIGSIILSLFAMSILIFLALIGFIIIGIDRLKSVFLGVKRFHVSQ